MKHSEHDPSAARRRGPRAACVGALGLSLLLASCAGSSEGTGDRPASNPTAPATAAPEPQDRAPEFPPGKFTVQLGAFQSEEGADAASALARTRFSREVYTVRDRRDGLYKVMMGVFDTKELARSFRDAIVRQYPGEYRDAWVSELVR